MGSTTWHKKLVIALYIVSAITLLVSLERMAFDAIGQMWLTMFINGLTAMTMLICVMGTFLREKVALIAFIICSVLTFGVNVVIILIYNDIGFQDKEHYLGLSVSDDSFWMNHGFLCYNVCGQNSDAQTGSAFLANEDGMSMDMGSSIGEPYQECFASYIVIETAHASLSMLLVLISTLMAFIILCTTKSDEEESDEDTFMYEGIGRYGGNGQSPHHRRTFYKLSDTADTLRSLSSQSPPL